MRVHRTANTSIALCTKLYLYISLTMMKIPPSHFDTLQELDMPLVIHIEIVNNTTVIQCLPLCSKK